MNEHLEVDSPHYAGFWRRLLAYLIDGVLLVIVFKIISTLTNLDQTFSYSYDPVASAKELLPYMLFVILITWLYYALLESSDKQATFGKIALKLRVTDEEGKQIGFGRATGRFFGKIVSAIILYIGFLMAGWTKKKQALHDIIAQTLVVRD